MKVIKFKIRNYKSIVDSGDCYLDDKITILAGKNEAGKTAIVEALGDFDLGKSISQKAIPLWEREALPRIDILIELEEEEIEEFFTYLQNDILKVAPPGEFKISKKIIRDCPIELSKIYPNINKVSDKTLSAIHPAIKSLSNTVERLKEIIYYCNEKTRNFPVREDMIKVPQRIVNLLTNYSPQYRPNVSNEEQQLTLKNIEEIKHLLTESDTLIKISYEIEQFILQNFIPNFILFVTFDDILPTQIPITKAQEEEIIKDLASISGLDLKKIQSSEDPKIREHHKDQVNLKLSEDYKQFWTQDYTNLYFSLDTNNIYFWIREGKEYYNPDMRSKGKQWHLSFYIRITARSLEGKKNVILIDEPGLFLHAKAQRDILRKLEDCSKKTQIIYTTHSPYLIPSETLNRVRLVRKYETKGTKIEKLTAKADKETLTPILTAIGEDLSAGIKVDKKNPIVLEGFSDYLYFTAFKNLLNIKIDINFIPSVGANNVIHVGSILFGWGLDPIFILDNDREGKRVRNKLIDKLSIKEEKIILVPLDKEGKIENMFSKEDFEKYIKGEKTNKKGKVLTATQLYQEVEKDEIELTDFTKETKENFGNVFKKIKELIG